MTKSWWTGGPEERLIDRAIPEDYEGDAARGEDEPATRKAIALWWLIAGVILMLLAAAGVALWLIVEAADRCSDVAERCFEPDPKT